MSELDSPRSGNETEHESSEPNSPRGSTGRRSNGSGHSIYFDCLESQSGENSPRNSNDGKSDNGEKSGPSSPRSGPSSPRNSSGQESFVSCMSTYQDWAGYMSDPGSPPSPRDDDSTGYNSDTTCVSSSRDDWFAREYDSPSASRHALPTVTDLELLITEDTIPPPLPTGDNEHESETREGEPPVAEVNSEEQISIPSDEHPLVESESNTSTSTVVSELPSDFTITDPSSSSSLDDFFESSSPHEPFVEPIPFGPQFANVEASSQPGGDLGALFYTDELIADEIIARQVENFEVHDDDRELSRLADEPERDSNTDVSGVDFGRDSNSSDASVVAFGQTDSREYLSPSDDFRDGVIAETPVTSQEFIEPDDAHEPHTAAPIGLGHPLSTNENPSPRVDSGPETLSSDLYTKTNSCDSVTDTEQIESERHSHSDTRLVDSECQTRISGDLEIFFEKSPVESTSQAPTVEHVCPPVDSGCQTRITGDFEIFFGRAPVDSTSQTPVCPTVDSGCQADPIATSTVAVGSDECDSPVDFGCQAEIIDHLPATNGSTVLLKPDPIDSGVPTPIPGHTSTKVDSGSQIYPSGTPTGWHPLGNHYGTAPLEPRRLFPSDPSPNDFGSYTRISGHFPPPYGLEIFLERAPIDSARPTTTRKRTTAPIDSAGPTRKRTTPKDDPTGPTPTRKCTTPKVDSAGPSHTRKRTTPKVDSAGPTPRKRTTPKVDSAGPTPRKRTTPKVDSAGPSHTRKRTTRKVDSGCQTYPSGTSAVPAGPGLHLHTNAEPVNVGCQTHSVGYFSPPADFGCQTHSFGRFSPPVDVGCQTHSGGRFSPPANFGTEANEGGLAWSQDFNEHRIPEPWMAPGHGRPRPSTTRGLASPRVRSERETNLSGTSTGPIPVRASPKTTRFSTAPAIHPAVNEGDENPFAYFLSQNPPVTPGRDFGLLLHDNEFMDGLKAFERQQGFYY